MAAGGRSEFKGFFAKEMAERRRLKDVLSEELSRDLLRLLNEEIHADLVLCVRQTKFNIHRAVLMARVPTFYKLLTKDSLVETTALENVEPSEIKAFLTVVYSSHWSVSEREDHILRILGHDHLVESKNSNNSLYNNIRDSSLPAMEDSKEDKHLLCLKDSDVELLNENNVHEKEDLKDNGNMSDQFDPETASELGKDLLSLFQRCCCPDITIQITDTCFQAHRAILCARSSYFAAMLSGCWAESSQELIQIQGISHVDMSVVLQFVYGGILDLPQRADVGHIFSIADMYGFEGLKEVAIYILKRDYCKFFHKPVVGLQHSVLECLCITQSLGEQQLYTSCMRWIEKYFVKCWSERSFANLPADLQKNCLTALVQSLSYRNAAFLLMESDRLVSSLPGVKWAETARILATELEEECVRFMVTNFSQIIKTESFSQLLQAQGMSSNSYLLEQVFNEIEKSISFQNCSSLFIALDELLALAVEKNMGFTCKIQALRDKLWTFLVQSFYAVRHTEGWNLMRPDNQQRIQAAAFDKGDDRRLGKKPIFTSSQQYRSRTGELKETLQKIENKSRSEGDLSSHRKMKSDSLGASGHTNVTRNSSAKGKEDDLKGKDGKKLVAKVIKDPKATDKTVSTKPKLIAKTKAESNGTTKMEGCSAKGDIASIQKSIPSAGRGGARPKAPNGTTNPQTKVKTLKKTGKESASPVRGTVPSMRSKDESPNSKISPEHNHDATAEVRPNSANCSPHSAKAVRNGLDSSSDLGASMKLKTATKITNGATTKRKSNEAELRVETSSSSMKKISANGGNEPIVQKKKGIKIVNCTTQQRPASAPAALSKKQGIQGDGANQAKSVVSSKQTEAKSDVRLLNQSTSTDKSASVHKKSPKATITSLNKTNAKPTVPVSKQNVNGTKTSAANHKELKQKATAGTLSKVSSLNHNSEQKIASKNGHDQRACGLDPALSNSHYAENHPISKNECRQTVSSQFIDLSGNCEQEISEDLASAAYDCCQENSIDNQDCKIQKPISQHYFCHENLSPAPVQLYALNMKPVSTETKNQMNAHNVKSAEEDCSSNRSEDQKPDGKSICDSENSNKCADSSSESELCSVKEVEKNTKQMDTNATLVKCPAYSNRTMHNSVNAAESFTTCCQTALNSGKDFVNCIAEKQSLESSRDMSITEAIESQEKSEMQFVGLWNKCSGSLHERESPESESGSASTSSDDIKPRSEDYDAGGSQDDDGSNERGISKCSTMRCHDFLGRSSSDTSTPEELKGYDGSLRIDVKMKKENPSDLFRVNSTSDDEGPRKRPDKWMQREVPKHNVNQKAVCNNVQFPPEIEHLSSSADETEDERSEAENAVEKSLSDAASQPFQGIINLAFDDTTELDNEGQPVPGSKKFMRSVLLSVDECEELGSDEGEPQASQARNLDSVTPGDVFENICNHPQQKYSGASETDDCFKEFKIEKESRLVENKMGRLSDPHLHNDELVKKGTSAETLPTEDERHSEAHDIVESDICKGYYKHPESEFKSQTRPCRLDLYTTDSPSDTSKFCSTKTVKPCKNQFHGKETHASPTENSNTALPAGHIDDFDSLAQTCMYEHRPSKSLSPIYEVDPGAGIEQKMKTEANIVDFDFEDQHFVESDWILLRQLLADHSSDVDVINSVPEDLSLAQYLINQTLLLARENSKSQGKSHVELLSPFDDSTSVTMTSFSPDDCASPHGEWTILELETHH